MSNHYFFTIRSYVPDEVIGIAKTRRNMDIRYVYHPEMTNISVATRIITEAEYETYKEFDLFPVYKLVDAGAGPCIDGSWGRYIDIYDPIVFEYFVPGKSIVRRNVMPNA